MKHLNVFSTRDDIDPSLKLNKRRGGGGHSNQLNFDNVDATDDFIIDSENDEEIDEEQAFGSDDDLQFYTRADETLSEGASNSEDDDAEYMDLSQVLDLESEEKPVKTIQSFLPINNDSEKEAYTDSDDNEQSGFEEPDLTTMVDNLPYSKRKSKAKDISLGIKESEYALKKNIKKQDLISSLLQDNAEFGLLKQQLKGNTEALEKPMPGRAKERLERQAANELVNQSVSKWTGIVKKNREAETLSFPMNVPPPKNITSGALVGKFEPFTDMEKEISKVLEESGLTEAKQAEFETLELVKLSKEQLKERQAELSKLRSLMFFQEKKQKRVAKIKSKTYRKLARKSAAAEQVEDDSPEHLQEMLDKQEFERVKQRMTLKRKGSKRAQQGLLGQEDGDESQLQMMEQLKREEELLERIEGNQSDSETDKIQNFDSDSDNDISSMKQKGVQELEKLKESSSKPQTGLFGMKFMQRAMEKQQVETNRMIDQAQNELLGNAAPVEPISRRKFDADPDSKPNNSINGDNESGSDFEENDFVVKLGPTNIFKVESFDLEEHTEGINGNVNKVEIQQESSNTLQTSVKPIFNQDTKIVKDNTTTAPIKCSVQKKSDQKSESVDNDAQNPWLVGDDLPAVKKRKPKHESFEKMGKAEKAMLKLDAVKKVYCGSKDEAGNEEVVDSIPSIEIAGPLKAPKLIDNAEKQAVLNTTNNDIESTINETSNDGKKSRKRKRKRGDGKSTLNLENLTGTDIMQMAFANDNIEADFEAEKEELANRETGIVHENAMPGWGAWTGPGVISKPRIITTRKKGGIDLEKRKDRNLQHVIINEKRMKKQRVPHGFDNRDQYERTIATPLGKEWNTLGSHSKLVQPKVVTKVGTVIHPLKLSGKAK